jgi:glyoxylase-like metal-dependent hydrolase (beta-lactamase superfamily II)
LYSPVFTRECSCFWAAKRRARFTFGRGHTNGDAFVYFPALKTLHTGDMMAGTTPLIDYTGGGSLKAWTETARRRAETGFRYGDAGARSGDD